MEEEQGVEVEVEVRGMGLQVWCLCQGTGPWGKGQCAGRPWKTERLLFVLSWKVLRVLSFGWLRSPEKGPWDALVCGVARVKRGGVLGLCCGCGRSGR